MFTAVAFIRPKTGNNLTVHQQEKAYVDHVFNGILCNSPEGVSAYTVSEKPRMMCYGG